MTKRIISVLLALVLVLALAMPAMASETQPTLTIKNDIPGKTYDVYQVFTGTLSSKQDFLVLSDVAWGSGIKADHNLGDAQAKADELTALDNNSDGAKAFAKAVDQNLSGTKAGTITIGEDGIGAVSLAPGYYLVKETDVETDEVATAFILEVVGNAEAAPKRPTIPTPEKKANKDDVFVGETIEYTLTGKTPVVNYVDYDYYYFALKDTLCAGLDLDESSIQVSVAKKNGEAIAVEEGTDYTVSVTNKNGETVLTVAFADIIDSEIPAESVITVTYNAELNASAVKGVDGNPNKVVIEYSNNPDSEDHGETTPVEVTVFTVDLVANKVNTAEEPLANATFVLKNEAKEYYYLDSENEVAWGTKEQADEITSGTNGKITFAGVGEGEYYLEEIAAPEGYNKLTQDVKVEIIRGTDGFTVKVDDVEVKGEGDVVTVFEGETVEINVENKAGTTLPSTGGIGTTIFYLVGGLMMAAAVVLLVAKKRTVNE